MLRQIVKWGLHVSDIYMLMVDDNTSDAALELSRQFDIILVESENDGFYLTLVTILELLFILTI